MYAEDSFFTLTSTGRAGVLTMSLALALLMVGLVRVVPLRSAFARVGVAFMLFWLFVWLSPQAYYQLYRLLFDGLPQHWVIWPPRRPAEALRLLAFSGPETLSAHEQGALGWLMIAAALLRPFLFRRDAAN